MEEEKDKVGLLMLEQLKAIRSEMGGMRAEQAGMRAEQAGMRAEQVITNERLGRVEERLNWMGQEQIRHATAIVDLEKGQREVIGAINTMAGEIHGLNTRIDNILTGALGTTVRDHELRLAALERKVG